MPVDNQLLAAAAIGIAVVLLIGLYIWRRRRRRSLPGRLRQASVDQLSNILVPNGDGGEIHIEHALLTHSGVVVIDIKSVDGNVFGSDTMQDWMVISDKRRFTFSNPQPALYDRVAAVSRLAPDIPVQGYVAFTRHAKFTKGCPSDVVLIEELIDQLNRDKKHEAGHSVDAFYANWTRLREEAVATQVGRFLKD